MGCGHVDWFGLGSGRIQWLDFVMVVCNDKEVFVQQINLCCSRRTGQTEHPAVTFLLFQLADSQELSFFPHLSYMPSPSECLQFLWPTYTRLRCANFEFKVHPSAQQCHRCMATG
jgi:hypothetical protein